MLRALRPALLLGFLAACTVGASTPTIPPEAVLSHIRFLASDELKGRGNGSPGLERAADYIAAEFRKAGLEAGSTEDGWFQPFEITTGVAIGTHNGLTIRAGGRTARATLGESYYPLAATPDDSIVNLAEVPLVFAGYGISAPGFTYDDYAAVDVSGKAVLIFSHEPQEHQRDSRLNGTRPLRETTLHQKAEAARTRGARALIVVSDPSHPTDEANYRMFPIESDVEDHGIPVLRVRRTEMAPVFQALKLDAVAAAIDRDLKPRSRVLTGAAIDYTQELATRRQTVRNVVGILRGTDAARSGEAVVLGGHYDHVGLGGRFSSAPERTGEIHNGADDNASGVSALIEIARAAAANRSRFPRSLVFVAFAGEERGLLGSVHYAEHPAIPLGDTVAMLNLDMIGRSRGRVEAGGLEASGPLRAEVDAAAREVGIAVRPGGPGAGRSDDSSFLDRQVPALHFFTGFHDEYHHPGDDWERIDATGTARVAALALEVAARLAGRDDKLPFPSR